MQEENSLKVVEFILKELRTMQGEMLIYDALKDKALQSPKFDEKTCFTDFVNQLMAKVCEQNEMIKKLSYNEGKYDAYEKILNLLKINFAN